MSYRVGQRVWVLPHSSETVDSDGRATQNYNLRTNTAGVVTDVGSSGHLTRVRFKVDGRSRSEVFSDRLLRPRD